MSSFRITYFYRRIAPWLVIALFIGVLVYLSARYEAHMNKYARYTIGVTTETFYKGDGKKMVKYNFSVNNKSYSGAELYKDCVVPGGRYYVKFSKKKTSYNELLLDMPVPNSVEDPPPEGWEQIPQIE